MMKKLIKFYIITVLIFISSVSYASPDINQDPGDYTYFHSRHIINSKASYKNTTFEAKTGNSYTAERFDYKNPEKGECIILTKNGSDATNNDVYFQTSLMKRSEFLPDDGTHYKYYCLKGDFNVSKTLLKWQVCMLRDVTDGTYQETTIMYNCGKLQLISGGKTTTLKSYVSAGTDVWHNIIVLYNLKDHKIDVYLDNECLASDIAISDTVNKPAIMRCNLNYGKGVVKVKNWEFTGLAKPFGRKTEAGKTVPVINHTSVFPDDTAVREYLNGKTVFHGEGNILYKNGTKIPFVNKADYTDEELCISTQDINIALDKELIFESGNLSFTADGKKYNLTSEPYKKDGIIYVPVGNVLDSLGISNGFSYYGKMIVSEAGGDISDYAYNPSWFDEQFHAENGYPVHSFSEAEEISNYIFFDRPSAEKLEGDFNKNADNFAHPRLLINSDDVKNLRNRRLSDYHFRFMTDRIIKNADTALTAAEPMYKFDDNMRTKANAENIVRRLLDLAFAYIITGDTKYSERAVSDLMAVSEFPDLNAAHIIDTGVWLKGLAISYDWCYNEMTGDERKKIAEFIYERGIKETNRAYYSMLPSGGDTGFNEANWFPRWKSNYIAFVQGGLVPACLAVADVYPEVCFDTLEKTFRSWEYMLYGFYDGGVWLEGKVYEKVVHHYTAYAMASVIKCMGDDYSIMEYKGLYESFKTALGLTSLTASFSYGDDSINKAYDAIDESWAFYGDYYNDDMIRFARGMISTGKFRNRYFSGAGTPEILDLIFYDDKADETKVTQIPKVITAEGMELFSLSENRLDKNALYFATSAGVSKHYHQHNDSGDFILCMDGEVWTYELGQGNYNTGSIYTRYSGRTEAHNTITINPDENFSQAENAYAPITEYKEGEGGAYVVYDMTELYAHHGATDMKRGFYIGDGYSYLTVRDEMNFNTEVTGYWFMNSKATLTKVSDDTIKMTQNGKTMYAKFICEGADARLSIMDSVPLPTSPNPENITQSSIKKIAIYFEGSGQINLTVKLSRTNESVDITPVSEWENKMADEKYSEPEQPGRALAKHLCTEDFENVSGSVWEFSKNNQATASATIQGNEDNKYLFVDASRKTTDTSITACSLFFDSGLEPGDKFTAEYDLKLKPYDAFAMKGYDGNTDKYTEYNIGLSDKISSRGAYVTLNPYFNAQNVYSNKNASIFGARLVESVCYDPNGINWYDWNRIRWVSCEDVNGNNYAEIYVNGNYYGKVGLRGANAELTGVSMSIGFNKGISSGGFYIDNLSFYEGQTDTQSKYSLRTLDDRIPTFYKDFEDMSEGQIYTEELYPYYAIKNTADSATVTSGSVKAESDKGNMLLSFENGSSVCIPNAVSISDNEKTTLEFKAYTTNGTMSAGLSSGDSATDFIRIGNESVIFGEKTYLYKVPEEKYLVQIVFEKQGQNVLLSLYINGTEIAYREKYDMLDGVVNQEFEPEFFNLIFKGPGKLDNVSSVSSRGCEEPDVRMTKVNVNITGNTLTAKVMCNDLEKDAEPTLYSAVYTGGVLKRIKKSPMTLSGDEYIADVPYEYTEGADMRLFIMQGQTLVPLTFKREIFHQEK